MAVRIGKRVRISEKGCHEWTGTISFGYGHLNVEGKTKKAHRVVWEMVHGPIPDGTCVLHRCDNKRCVNTGHLFLGTIADNNADRHSKGRTVVPDNNGEKNGMATLTPKEVEQIRILGQQRIKQRIIASQFGIGQNTVSRILNRKRWATL